MNFRRLTPEISQASSEVSHVVADRLAIEATVATNSRPLPRLRGDMLSVELRVITLNISKGLT
jgi:hypothetical protein